MSSLTTIATLLDAIAAQRCDLVHVGFELERHERDPGGDVGEAVLAALQLQHAQPDDEGRTLESPKLKTERRGGLESLAGPAEPQNFPSVHGPVGLLCVAHVPSLGHVAQM